MPIKNSPAGTSTIGTSSLPVAGTGVDVFVSASVLVGWTIGLGVAVGTACMMIASGGSVGPPGAGGVTVGNLLTSHVAMITRVGDETSVGAVGVGVDVLAPRVGGTGGVGPPHPEIVNTIMTANANREGNLFEMSMSVPQGKCCPNDLGV